MVGAPQGLDERHEILLGFRQGSRPHLPVGLGVGFPVVQGHSIGRDVLLVAGELRRHCLLGEQAGAKELIPDDVVLHAEGARAVKGQPEAPVAIGGHWQPMFRHFLGGPVVRPAVFPQEGQDDGHPFQGHDGFQGQVAVVGQMAGEIIGAELVFRVQAVSLQIIRPLGQQG